MSRSTIGIAQELGVGDLEGAVDVAVDGERPAVGLHPGDHERGVDPVELRRSGCGRRRCRARCARGPWAGRRAARPAAGSVTDDGDDATGQHLPDGATGGGEGTRARRPRRARAAARPAVLRWRSCRRPRPPRGRGRPRPSGRAGRGTSWPHRRRRPRWRTRAGGRPRWRWGAAPRRGRSPSPGRRAGPGRACGGCGPRGRCRRRGAASTRATEPMRIGLSAVPKVRDRPLLDGRGGRVDDGGARRRGPARTRGDEDRRRGDRPRHPRPR